MKFITNPMYTEPENHEEVMQSFLREHNLTLLNKEFSSRSPHHIYEFSGANSHFDALNSIINPRTDEPMFVSYGNTGTLYNLDLDQNDLEYLEDALKKHNLICRNFSDKTGAIERIILHEKENLALLESLLPYTAYIYSHFYELNFIGVQMLKKTDRHLWDSMNNFLNAQRIVSEFETPESILDLSKKVVTYYTSGFDKTPELLLSEDDVIVKITQDANIEADLKEHLIESVKIGFEVRRFAAELIPFILRFNAKQLGELSCYFDSRFNGHTRSFIANFAPVKIKNHLYDVKLLMDRMSTVDLESTDAENIEQIQKYFSEFIGIAFTTTHTLKRI